MELKKLKINNKKGVMGLEIAIGFVLSLLTLAIIVFAVIVALSTLNNSNVLTANSLEANQTSDILLNVTGGAASLFTNVTTWFSLIAVVIIILIISVVIIAVKRFGGEAGTSGL